MGKKDGKYPDGLLAALRFASMHWMDTVLSHDVAGAKEAADSNGL